MWYVALFKAGYGIFPEPTDDCEMCIGPFNTFDDATRWVDTARNAPKERYN